MKRACHDDEQAVSEEPMNQKLEISLRQMKGSSLLLIAGLAILIGSVNHAFNSISTVVNLARTMLVTLIFAMCEMLVIVSGGIDVSFPAIASLAMIATGNIMLKNGLDNVPLAFLMGAIIGGVLGTLNARTDCGCEDAAIDCDPRSEQYDQWSNVGNIRRKNFDCSPGETR
jgi:predicted ABC-type sugar transport system permease subunit